MTFFALPNGLIKKKWLIVVSASNRTLNRLKIFGVFESAPLRKWEGEGWGRVGQHRRTHLWTHLLDCRRPTLQRNVVEVVVHTKILAGRKKTFLKFDLNCNLRKTVFSVKLIMHRELKKLTASIVFSINQNNCVFTTELY